MKISLSPKEWNVIVLISGILIGCVLVLLVTGYFTSSVDSRSGTPNNAVSKPSRIVPELPVEPMEPMDYETGSLSNATTTPLRFNNNISVLESHLVRVGEGGPQSISGVLVNTGKEYSTSIQMVFRLYNSAGKPLGNAVLMQDDVISGRNTTFEVLVLDEDAVAYKIKSVDVNT